MRTKIDNRGTQWCYNDKNETHRLDGPAIIYKNGDQVWYRNNLPHRLDGPATTSHNKKQDWLWLGRFISEKQHSILSNIKFFTRRVQI